MEGPFAGWWSFVFKPCSSAEFSHSAFSLLLQKQDFSVGLFIFWTVKYWGTRRNLSLCLWNSVTLPAGEMRVRAGPRSYIYKVESSAPLVESVALKVISPECQCVNVGWRGESAVMGVEWGWEWL